MQISRTVIEQKKGTQNFPLVHKALLKFGYNIAASALNVYCSLQYKNTAKEVKDRDYKKIFIQANEIDSPCPRKMKRVDSGVENPSTSDELSCLEPKQLSFYAPTFPSASFTEDARASPTSAQNHQQGCSPLDSKHKEMKDSLTVTEVTRISVQPLYFINQTPTVLYNQKYKDYEITKNVEIGTK